MAIGQFYVMYTVKLKQFQGPLDLLLQLIEEKKLDIIEISLAKITDQYLGYLRKIDDISLEDLAEFLVIASRLILIKSRMLLPSIELTDEEEEDIEALKKQLEEYKKIKDLATEINSMAIAGNIAYSREKYHGLSAIFYPPKNVKVDDLKNAFKKVLDEIALLEERLPEENIKLKISLEEKINYIRNELASRVKTSFRDITKNNKSKADVIISFLALLELIKQRMVSATQKGLFHDIHFKQHTK